MNGRIAKKIRREVKAVQQGLARDLKTWLRDRPLAQRIKIAFCIIFKKKW